MAGVAMPCCNGTCDCVLCNVVQKRLIESQSLISSAKRLCLEIAPPEKEANRLCAEKMKGHARLGSKIKVYWPDDKKWYRGKVGDVFNAEKKVEVQVRQSTCSNAMCDRTFRQTTRQTSRHE